MNLKMYRVVKYVKAKSLSWALRIEKVQQVDCITEEYDVEEKVVTKEPTSVTMCEIGFQIPKFNKKTQR